MVYPSFSYGISPVYTKLILLISEMVPHLNPPAVTSRSRIEHAATHIHQAHHYLLFLRPCPPTQHSQSDSLASGR